MEAIINIAQFIANNLFNQLAIMMAIIALIGLLFQKKSIEQAIAGALRAAIGVIILNVGVSVFTGELSYFTNIMSSAFGMETPQATGNMNQFILARGGDIALVVAFSFILHVILVRFSIPSMYISLRSNLLAFSPGMRCHYGPFPHGQLLYPHLFQFRYYGHIYDRSAASYGTYDQKTNR